MYIYILSSFLVAKSLKLVDSMAANSKNYTPIYLEYILISSYITPLTFVKHFVSFLWALGTLASLSNIFRFISFTSNEFSVESAI